MNFPKKIAVLSVLMCLIVLIAGCSQPEYMNPYGEGVDPKTVVTKPFQSKPTSTTTGLYITPRTTTTTAAPTTTTELVVPDGYHRCPDCHGIREMCRYCKGTDIRLMEFFDPDAGVYGIKEVGCTMCSEEDPGYSYCEMCRNRLVLKD